MSVGVRGVGEIGGKEKCFRGRGQEIRGLTVLNGYVHCTVKAEGFSGKVYKMKRSGRMVTEENLAHCGKQLRSL